MSETPPNTDPVDPATVPMDLTGLKPEEFNVEPIVAKLKLLSEEQVTQMVTEIQSIRHRIFDDRQYLASLAGALGKVLSTAVKVVV